jgi:hypothetical protein
VIGTINDETAGTCVWCRQHTDEGVGVQFKDGLSGFFCKKDFWAALKARHGAPDKKVETPPGVKSSQS